MRPSPSPISAYIETMIQVKATQLIGRYGYTSADGDDLAQEFRLDLLTRLPKFDRTKASLNTFASRVVDNRAATLIRHRSQQCRDYRKEAGSLDDPLDDGEGSRATTGEGLSQDESAYFVGRLRDPEVNSLDLTIDVRLAIRDLPRELADLATRLATKPIAEVARELNVPRSTLYDARIARIRRLFEDRGLQEHL